MANQSFKLTGLTPLSTLSGVVLLIKEQNFINADANCLDGVTYPQGFSNGGGNLIVYADATKAVRYPIHVVSFVTGVTPFVVVRVGIPNVAAAASIHVEADDVQTTQPLPNSTFGQYAAYQSRFGHVSFDNSSDSATGGDVISYTESLSGNSFNNPTNDTSYDDTNAWLLNGTDQYIGVKTPVKPPVLTSPFTINAAVKFSSFDLVSDSYIIVFTNSDGSERLVVFSDLSASNNWKIGTQGETPGDAGFAPSVGVWYHVALIWDGSNFELVVNGSLAYAVTPTGFNWQTATATTLFGSDLRSGVYDKFFNGTVAELYSKQEALSVDYLNYEYLNQSDPDSFWTSSDFVAGGGAAPTPYYNLLMS